MGRLTDKEAAAREGVTDRAIRKRRKAEQDKANASMPAMDLSGFGPGEAADIRHKNARAAASEDLLARKRGELIPVAEVRMECTRTTAAAKARLLAIPGQLTVRCGLDARAVEVLDGLIKDACRELLTKWEKEA